MVRICDGRMSGTAYGTVVLHVAPEAAAGGPLALVRTGDVDHPRRRRPAASTSTCPPTNSRRGRPTQATVAGFADPRRGWERLYVDHVLQADTGADLDFLVGSSGSEVQPRVALTVLGRPYEADGGRDPGQLGGVRVLQMDSS